jgi:DNA modification methylase
MAKSKPCPPAAPSAPTHIKDLVPDPANRSAHNPRNIGMVVDALHQVGAARSIVIDEDNVILAGNGVTEAAAEAGITKVRVIEAAGDELIAVRRSGLSSAQKRHLAIADNRTAELATWNAAQFREDLAGGADFAAFFTEDELREIVGTTEEVAGQTDPDDVPAARPTSVVAGDLFELGRHRLLCGDATSQGDVGRLLAQDKPLLMVTDPPYGVNYDPEWRKRAGVNNSDRMGRVMNDDRADWTDVWRTFPGAVAYVWHGGVAGAEVQTSLFMAEFIVRCQIIWRKPRIVLSRGHYHWQHEPCFYAVRKGRTGHWGGKRNQSSVWTVTPTLHTCSSCGSVEIESAPADIQSTVWDIEQRDGTGDTVHGTQKPVECMARPMRNHDSALVFEPFSGSGTTIIAGEMNGRSVLATELDPVYVQVALDRWEAFTGQKAQKVGEAVRA